MLYPIIFLVAIAVIAGINPTLRIEMISAFVRNLFR
jgi:hypothetical protein